MSRREQVEEHTRSAFEGATFEDPRDRYRSFLRTLREHDAAAFERAVVEYEPLVEAICAGGDPRTEWLRYGERLAAGLPGRTVAIDEQGRAGEWSPGHEDGDRPPLVLHLPDDRGIAPLALAVPRSPAPAQRATLDLLVEGCTSVREV